MEKLIEIKNLKKYFDTPKGQLHAVDDINLTIELGKTLGVVGESGCGKSTLGRTVLRLIEPTAGQVIYKNENILELPKRRLKPLRNEMQMIFQDPYTSLNPRMSVFDIVAEPLIVNKILNKRQRNEKVFNLMETVGLARRMQNTYPH